MNSLLHSIAKSRLGGLLIRWAVNFPQLIPGEKLLETDSLLAFHHPTPSYPLHILIVPRSGQRSLADLPSQDLAFEADLFRAVQQLVREFNLEESSYRLIANGGGAQEVGYLHFHLISEDYQAELESK